MPRYRPLILLHCRSKMVAES